MPEQTMQTKFFHFRQNNSGGVFRRDDNLDVHVIIEALDTNHANTLAPQLGIYFDGVRAGRDCGCCGDRWAKGYREGTDRPCLYNDPSSPIESVNWEGAFVKGDGAYVHYLDGRKEHYGAPIREK